MKNTHGGVLLLACNFTKSNTPPWVFFTFLNCTNGTKSRKAPRMTIVFDFHLTKTISSRYSSEIFSSHDVMTPFSDKIGWGKPWCYLEFSLKIENVTWYKWTKKYFTCFKRNILLKKSSSMFVSRKPLISKCFIIVYFHICLSAFKMKLL